MFAVCAILVGTFSECVGAQNAPALVHAGSTAPFSMQSSTVRTYRIASSILNESRTVHIAFPVGYDKTEASRRYPVAIVLDGEYSIRPASAVFDELSDYGQIPASVIVAIENTNRLRDFTPPGLSVSGSSTHEGGDRFLDFIDKELLPAIERQFHSGAPRTLIGHSSGGIIATYAAATRNTFRAVIALDAPTELGDDWLAEKLITHARAPGAVPLRYVSIESVYGWRDKQWASLKAAAPPSWTLYREHLTHETHESMPMLAMYIGLREAFNDYSIRSAPAFPSTTILPYYDKLNATLDAPLSPPAKLLRRLVGDLLSEGRGRTAHRVFDLLRTGYGAPSDSVGTLRRIAEVEARPEPTETVEGLLAAPFSTAAEAAPYIGDWVGGVWMNDDEPRSNRSTLRISIRDGKVYGETVDRLPDGETLTRPWQYFKVTRDGFTFGFMNGMRPRAVLLYEGALKGDTLSGTIRFGGMDFRMDDGSRPPDLHFSFQRVTK